MIFVRGNPSDFDRWETRYGCTGWGYQSVLPHFKRSEDRPGGIHYFVGWVARNGFNHRMCRASLIKRGWLRVLRLVSPVLRTLMAQSRKDLDLSMPALQMADGRARRLHTSMGARHLD